MNVYKDLKTLILDGAKGLKPNTYLDKIDINKEDENGILSYKTFNLQSILNGEIKVILDENDQVKIYSLAEVEGSKTVSISGYGVRAKTVTIRENLSLFDLIFQSVSYDELEFQSKVLTSRLDLKRFDEQTGLYNLTQYSLDRLEDLKVLAIAMLIPLIINSITEFGIFGEANYGILFYQLVIVFFVINCTTKEKYNSL